MRKANETSDLVRSNNQLRKKLTTENNRYYSDLLLYVRTAGFLYNNYAVESKLLEILQDILDAQEDGITAEDYFGKRPAETANELIKDFPKANFFERFKFFGGIFGVSIFWTLINQFSSKPQQLNILPFILNGIFMILATYVAFRIIHLTVYWKLISNKTLNFLVNWIEAMVMIAGFIGILHIKPEVLNIAITPTITIAVNVIISLLVFLALIFANKTWRLMLVASIPAILVFTITNILTTTNTSKMHDQIIMQYRTGLLVIAIIWLLGFLFWSAKRASK